MVHNLEKQKKELESENDEENSNLTGNVFLKIDKEKISNKIGIFGAIDEKLSMSIVSSLILTNSELEPGEDIEIYLSTVGGDVHEMFSIVDAINFVKKTRDVSVFCLGKVMSAGVLIASTATNGKRYSMPNTRFMIHEIIFDLSGSATHNSIEYTENLFLQEKYINSICSLTKLTKSKIQKLIKGGHHYYFDAEQAKKHGIIDEIIQ